jgi:dsDNA-binding SOS-regulon protein
MSHHPTSFFILDNEELGTCWIGQAKMTLDASGRSLLPHISRDQLVEYKKLIGEWEAKGLRCLNTQKCKTYEDKKQDPTFLYNKARKEVLRQIKKTGKMPKDATVEKYQIKDEEIKERKNFIREGIGGIVCVIKERIDVQTLNVKKKCEIRN